jgi:hypothetical protein
MFSAEMQDSLTKVFQESVANNTEMGGAFVAVNGRVKFLRGVADPDSTDNCYWKGTTAVTGFVVLAMWHTHPDPDGTTVNCRISKRPMTIANREGGGGSPTDWATAVAKGKPMYTRGPGYVFRLDHDLPPGLRVNNPNGWEVGAGRCATRIQV